MRAWKVWKHKKRGTAYVEIARAEVQSAEPIKEGAVLVVYRGEDGKTWCRPVSEFEDGRFEQVDVAAALAEGSDK